MARLIIVAGASGAGKTFLLQRLAKLRHDIEPIVKLSTRESREIEAVDILPGSDTTEVNKCEYTYNYCGNFYGIKKEDIDCVLRENKKPIVIVASCAKIAEIKRAYKNALVLYVQSVLSGEDLRRELEKFRYPIELSERLQRQNAGFMDYVSFFGSSLFDYVLLNNFSELLMQQIQYILDKEISRGVDPNYVFVVMPFKQEFDEIYSAIRSAGEQIQGLRLRIERVSEIKGCTFDITREIEESIKKSGVVVCDVSEHNPNVYYEFGYAMAKEKSIILIAKDASILPFDTRQYKTLMYSSAYHCQNLLKESLLSHYDVKE